MPGINQTQDQLISTQNLQTALAQLAQSSALLQQKQTELLVELSQKFRKAPSIIKSGSIFDIIRIYSNPIDSSNAYLMYRNFFGAGIGIGRNGIVGVLPLLDANEVEINVLSFPSASTLPPPFLAFALTPNDLNTIIPFQQFSLLPKYDFVSTGFPATAAVSGTNTENGTITGTFDPTGIEVDEVYAGTDSISEEISFAGSVGASMIVQNGRIPCAGNQYLHFFGIVGGIPYFNSSNNLAAISPAIWTYKLIK